jgi:hypothetical protein
MRKTLFERELLNGIFDVPEDSIWHIISLYWDVSRCEPYRSPFGNGDKSNVDIRRMTKWEGDYDGFWLEIDFSQKKEGILLLGVTHLGDSDHGRRKEHLLGSIEVRRISMSSNMPVNVRIVCNWKPFYMFFSDMANAIRYYFKQQSIDLALVELLAFKSEVERQTYKDIYLKKRPQENIARALLKMYLARRSYGEVEVRGGKSDILVFDKEGRFLYETKIWRGSEYYKQGLREIEEYIKGENTDNKLSATFYIVFDSTVTAAARRYIGSDLKIEVIANRTVHVIIVNINPPKPSKKPKNV